MIKFLSRSISINPLNVTLNSAENQTAVVVVPQGKPFPRWARLNPLQEQDFAKTKAIWVYPRTQYSRAVLLSYKNDVFQVAHSAIQALKTRKIASADLVVPRGFKQDQLEILANTAILSNYSHTRKTQFKTEDQENQDFKQVESLNLVHPLQINQVKFDRSQKSAICTLYARELANHRGTEANPQFIANQAHKLYSQNSNDLQITVLKGTQLKDKGLNLLYSVGKSALSPPHLVVLSYTGNPESTQKLAVVGKGVTFDTGGLNLKPSGNISDMYLDKSGACTALAAFKWAVESKINSNIICALALAENSIDSLSYKPNDILTSLKGLTVQIGNTDAQGRLCLADTFTYLQQHYSPTTIIDLATLTGACLVALGQQTAGIFGNNKKLTQSLIKAGSYYKEQLWELPITSQHKKTIKGQFADISNIGKSRYGGASTAAAFLERFIEKECKWAHLDIAGPGMGKKSRKHVPAGGTGFGVQTLTKFMEGFNQQFIK